MLISFAILLAVTLVLLLFVGFDQIFFDGDGIHFVLSSVTGVFRRSKKEKWVAVDHRSARRSSGKSAINPDSLDRYSGIMGAEVQSFDNEVNSPAFGAVGPVLAQLDAQNKRIKEIENKEYVLAEALKEGGEEQLATLKKLRNSLGKEIDEGHQRQTDALQTVSDSVEGIARALGQLSLDFNTQTLSEKWRIETAYLNDLIASLDGTDITEAHTTALHDIVRALEKMPKDVGDSGRFAQDFSRFLGSLKKSPRSYFLSLAAAAESARLLEEARKAVSERNFKEARSFFEQAAASRPPRIPAQDNIVARWESLETELLDLLQRFFVFCQKGLVGRPEEKSVGEALRKMNIELMPIDKNKTDFDPRFHESVRSDQGPAHLAARVILEVVQPGFRRVSNGQLLRKAQVVINAGR